MGPTGSGKSNVSDSVITLDAYAKSDQFINKLSGGVEKVKATGLMSATQGVRPHTVLYDGFRFVMVDTPGFDDTTRSDITILQIISDWLAKKCVIFYRLWAA